MFAVDGPGKLYSRMFAPHVLGISEDAATGSAAGPLGAFAVRYGLVARAANVTLINEQGTKMGRQSFLHIELAYGSDRDIPTKIEVGGSVVPIVSGELSLSEERK
jgi:PhzF family phenazine biosynthesis protein